MSIVIEDQKAKAPTSTQPRPTYMPKTAPKMIYTAEKQLAILEDNRADRLDQEEEFAAYRENDRMSVWEALKAARIQRMKEAEAMRNGLDEPKAKKAKRNSRKYI